MPLLGKIVVIKRNGTDGTEFPLTASCLFGRKLDCDIRIQLPQVSKEHCRIDFNENKELILTNLSSVNPTRINGEILQQSERLKHGDLITIIDRSFRFEYPPPPTPKKKRLSTSEKGDSVKVLQDQQVKSTPGSTDKKKSEHSSDTCLKDGSNLPTPAEQSVEAAGGESGKPVKSNTESTMSPFSELYHMVKRDLATKSPWKSRKVSDASAADTPNENEAPPTPKSSKKKRRSSNVKAVDQSVDQTIAVDESEIVAPDIADKPKRHSAGSSAAAASLKNTPQATPQNFSADQVAQQILSEKATPKSRRSSASQPQSPATAAATPKNATTPQSPAPSHSQTPDAESAGEAEAKQTPRTSPRSNAGKRFQVQEIVATPATEDQGKEPGSSRKHKAKDLPVPAPKRKRVSFGGQLSPELFDKRLPPNSPLRRGATPGRRSLGFTHTPQSLLRRASTIGLMGFRLDEAVQENPAKSPKRASPGKSAKTPSPARKSPSTKSTPSPKNKKSPSKSPSPATLRTPKSAVRTPRSSDASFNQTPTVTGRFSVSRISTPSPVQDHEMETKVDPALSLEATPKIPLRRRSSMKASARKTPKSALKSALEVMRSRRSGASRANLKVVSSWADIVKFGQTKPQAEGGVKKTATKQKMARPSKVAKPKTPARRLKDITSTGHADSPATIVIGRAFTRSVQPVGAAPKVVHNVVLFKKDMKMDEDLTGVADIFKTPANNKRKSGIKASGECPETPLGVPTVPEMSVMNTPEESGEMMVSPLSVASTAKLGRYNREAVTRLLQDNQEASLVDESSPQLNDSDHVPAPEVALALEMSSDDQKEREPQTVVRTPQQKAAPSECLTGVKRLLRTPKQKAGPVEDLRGRLLKTPKEPKQPQEESLEGVKELLKTPKLCGTPLGENMAGSGKSPKVKNSPVVCAAGMKRLLKTPKDKTNQEEDLTGVKQLMQTPKSKGEPLESKFRVKRLIKTPKQKNSPVEEDLTGIQQMMKTPKQKKAPVEEDLTGIQQMMKTPKQKKAPVEEDLTGIQQMMKTPKQKKAPVEEDLTGIQQMKTSKQKNSPVEEDLTGIQQMMKTPKQQNGPVEEDLTGIKQMMKTPKEKHVPVENQFGIRNLMKTPRQRGGEVAEDFTGLAELVYEPVSDKCEDLHDPTESIQIQETSTSVEDITSEDKENICPKTHIEKEIEMAPAVQDEKIEETGALQETKPCLEEQEVAVEKTTSYEEDRKVQEQPMEMETLVFEAHIPAVDAAPTLASPKQDAKQNVASPAKKTQRGEKAAQKSQKRQDQTDSGEDQVVCVPELSAPVRGRRAKLAFEIVTVPSPARKSARGRVQKSQLQDKSNQVEASKEPQETIGSEQECPIEEVKPKAVLEVEASFKSPAPAAKGKRGRKAKAEFDSTPVVPPPQESEPVVQGTAATESESPSSELEASAKTIIRGRRGRQVKTKEVEEPSELNAKISDIVELTVPEAAADEAAAVASKDPEVQEETNPPVKTNTRSKRGRHTKKTTEVEEPNELDTKSSDVVELAVPQGAAVEEAAIASANAEVQEETNVPVKANARSKRGRQTKKATEVEEPSKSETKIFSSVELTVPEAAAVEEAAIASENAEVQEATDVPVKTNARSKRGRQIKKTTKVEEPSESDNKSSDVIELTVPEAAAVEEPAIAPENTEVQDETNVPVRTNARSRRGRQIKKTTEVEKTSESDVKRSDALKLTVPEASSAVPSENAKIQKETNIPVKTNARSKRGRQTKKEALETAQVEETTNDTPAIVEPDVKQSGIPTADEPQTPMAKSGSGRRAKARLLKGQPVAEEPKVDAELAVVTEAECKMEVPAVKSGRGAKSRQLKSRVTEEAAVHMTETNPAVAETEDQVEKAARGGRRMKPKADASEVDHDAVEQPDPPAVILARGKRPAAASEESNVLVKRGRRGATVQANPPPVLKSSRGRKTVVTAEPEGVKEHTDSAEVSSKMEETSVEAVQTGSVEAASAGSKDSGSDVTVKRGRGRQAQKSRTTSKDKAVEEAGADSENTTKSSKKSVNWNSDLVSWKEGSPAVEDEKEEMSIITESKQSAGPPAKGRKGRVAKKLEEPVLEKPETAIEENSQPGGRGRAGASAASKPDEVAVTSKRGSKRKEMEEANNKAQDADSLPKRRRGKAATNEAQSEVAAVSKGRRAVAKEVEETTSAEPVQSEPKKEEKAARGRRKAAQEGDAVPAPQDPVPELATRRGARNPKKAEEADVPSAPVRRTRRK